ncbi:MAG: hypothetical protein KAR20_30060, partial [Candidatus Heimdallarchaeota archaeon]|nr:hypothetical protein [Candidatus Heimdallarchaeota archaeon]
NELQNSISIITRFLEEAWRNKDFRLVKNLVTSYFFDEWNDEQKEIFNLLYHEYTLVQTIYVKLINKSDKKETIVVHAKLKKNDIIEIYRLVFKFIKENNAWKIFKLNKPINRQDIFNKAKNGSLLDCENFLRLFPGEKNTQEVHRLIELKKYEKEIKKNQKIFDEIMKGNYWNHNELTCLTPEIARQLLKHERSLDFDFLTSINVDVARELAKNKDGLSFNSLTSISVDVARELAKNEGIGLILDGLTSISVEVAHELAKFNSYELSLDGLTSISVEIARELANSMSGFLILKGLTSISVEVAHELGKHKGLLFLDGLTSISVEVARELARHEGDLSLDGLSTITPEVAHELANYDGEWLSLDGLTSISVEVARELAKHDGE